MSSASASARKPRKFSLRFRKPNLRPSDAKVSSILMMVLAVFMVLIIAVGALGGWFLNQNLMQFERLRVQTEMGQLVTQMGSTMRGARVSLMVAARFDQEAEAKDNDPELAKQADAMVERAKGQIERVKTMFADFRNMETTTEEGRRLAMRIVTTYRPYMDDGVEPMVDAMNSSDYYMFYFINNSMGMARAEAFEEAVRNFVGYVKGVEAGVKAEAEAGYQQALIAIAAAVGLGVLLMIVMRIVFGRVVVKPLRVAGEHFDRIANGDLTGRITLKSRNEIGMLYESMRRMQQSLTRMVVQVREGVEQINHGSREIYAGNTDLSSRTEQQAASLQETAASMEELASTVRQNTDNARQADSLSKNASDVAHRGGKAVAGVVSTMDEISASSSKMADIVSVIDGIAFQTNILALNAAVEAARAGEQGKGFAVVAGEVRSLAQRSAQAAKEIKDLIDLSVTKIKSGAMQADDAGKVMDEVVTAIQGVTTIMGEISSASMEQSDGITQVNTAVSEMDSVVQQNAALVEEAAAAAGSLQEQAARLADAVAVFKVNANEVIDLHADSRELEDDSDGYGAMALPA